MLTRRAKLLQECNPPSAPEGYIVFRNAVDLVDWQLTEGELKLEDDSYIFNDLTKDQKRSQCPLLPDSPVVNKLRSFCRVHFAYYKMTSPVVITSAPGCNEQTPHTDYNIATFPVDINRVPWSVILCVDLQSQFVLWRNSHKHIRDEYAVAGCGDVARVDLHLNKGDVLVFRGDLLHAGARYERKNIRIHAYVDHPLVKRPPNETMTVDLIGNYKLREVVYNSSFAYAQQKITSASGDRL